LFEDIGGIRRIQDEDSENTMEVILEMILLHLIDGRCKVACVIKVVGIIELQVHHGELGLQFLSSSTLKQIRLFLYFHLVMRSLGVLEGDRGRLNRLRSGFEFILDTTENHLLDRRTERRSHFQERGEGSGYQT
jgi:hypothetical protein